MRCFMEAYKRCIIWSIKLKECMKKILFALILLTVLTACSKEEGEGGNSVITGKVLTKVYNNSFSHVLKTYYKPEADVYLIYGNGQIYDDHFKTNWDGSYRFEYLRKGDYKVFVYSIDTTGEYASGLYPLTVNVNIHNNNETVTAYDIEIIEKCDYDEGTSSISGKVYVLDYNEERTSLIQSYFGPDEDVYIVFDDDSFYFDDLKTYHDGSFLFSNLLPGKYTVYALSNDMANKTSRKKVPVTAAVTITQDYQHIDIGDLIIFK